ncbi:MAG: hypothetical protein OFPI_06250 [Osedax symbiont Rs2]|nr:MAG: hypothetical protein OFPI_06250 [Osedax symbiont Rs2]
MIKYIAALLLLCCAFIPELATASERGVISKIDYQHRAFTLAGKRYSVPRQIRVEVLGLDTPRKDFSSLVTGLLVQLRYVRASDNNRRVIELKLIPQ